MLELASPQLRLTVRPEIGAAVAQCEWLGEAGPVPVLRGWDGAGDDPNRHGCYPLVPWSNRISGGGIEADGRFWPLQPNWPGCPYPIHGDGWQRPWTVADQARDRVRLVLESREQPPFAYRAELTYWLASAGFGMALSVEQHGATPAPFGLGFHPWFPRTPATTLRARAATVWLETADHLPAGSAPVADRPEWDFARGRPLPAAWVNNGFAGWDGKAVIRWPERGLALEIAADPALASYILYSPSAAADFFCFEPVSHPVDAFHLPGRPGLRTLAAGERWSVACRFAVREDAP